MSLIVTKAVRMANMMSKPILGVVENYSYFQCPNCGEKHYIFGQSNLEQVAAEENVKILARVPMDPAMAPPWTRAAWRPSPPTTWSRWPMPSWPMRRQVSIPTPTPRRAGEPSSPRPRPFHETEREEPPP